MELKICLYLGAAIGIAVLLAAPPAQLRAQQGAPPAVNVGDSDLGGVVRGPNGPEAGVWVIAETTDLPTKFAEGGALPAAARSAGEIGANTTKGAKDRRAVLRNERRVNARPR